MCFGGTSTPALPPPPEAPPPAPKATDPEVKKAKSRSRQTAALAQGRDSTLLGGALQEPPKNSATKTLLGS